QRSGAVPVLQADPSQAVRIDSGAVPARLGRERKAIAGRGDAGAAPLVVEPVGVREERRRVGQPVLQLAARTCELVPERVVVELRQARVGTTVRPNDTSGLGEGPELLPVREWLVASPIGGASDFCGVHEDLRAKGGVL